MVSEGGICKLGFTLQLPASKVKDVIMVGYRARGASNVEFVYASLRDIISILAGRCMKQCRNVIKILSPERVVEIINEQLYSQIFGVSRGALNLGSNVFGVSVPLFCDALEYIRSSIQNTLCSQLSKCRNACAAVKGRLYYSLLALGCAQIVQSGTVESYNPRLLIVLAETQNGKQLNIALPLGSIEPARGEPDVCRVCRSRSGCLYSSIPVMYCPTQRLLLLGYPICEINSIGSPRCNTVTTPRCPLEYMFALQGMPNPKSHWLCQDSTIRNVLSGCTSHICDGRSVTPSCNDVYENEVRTEPIISKSWPLQARTLSILGSNSSVSLSVMQGTIRLSLDRYKVTIGNREEFIFKMYRPVSATIIDTYMLSLSLDERQVFRAATTVAALGPQSLPLKTLAVKAVAACLDRVDGYKLVSGYVVGGITNAHGVARFCLGSYKGLGKLGYRTPLRPGISGFRRLAELIVASAVNGELDKLLNFLDTVASEISSNPDYIAPVMAHSFTSLLATAIIASQDLTEEMLSAFLISKKGGQELVSIAYENIDGGYGFLTTLTLDDIRNELILLSSIVKRHSTNYVVPLRLARQQQPSPVNACERRLLDLLDDISKQLTSWAGQGALTIVPAWVIRLGINRPRLEQLCNAGGAQPSSTDINTVMRLITERAAYYFDKDFHDNTFIKLEESIRVDLNEVAQYLMTTNYAIDVLIHIIP